MDRQQKQERLQRISREAQVLIRKLLSSGYTSLEIGAGVALTAASLVEVEHGKAIAAKLLDGIAADVKEGRAPTVN